ncbi:MAG: family 65 glycosyl hydrolase [Eubacteriales bacterium]|nr:family 65 glycosyl hydrolase [Eubacteriales bacterium]
MAKSANRYFSLDMEKIVEKEFDPAHALESESIFSLANEHMGVRGYFEEGGGLNTLRGSYLGGVYETQAHMPESDYGGFVRQTHYMVTSADALATRLVIGQETLDLATCAFGNFTRTLDLYTGLLSRSFLWRTRNAGRVEVRFERLLSMKRPELVAQRVTLCALDMDAPTTLTLRVDGNIAHQNTGKCLWEDVSLPAHNSLAQLALRTESTGTTALYTLRTACAGTHESLRAYRTLGETYDFALLRGQEIVAERVVVVQVAHSGEEIPPLPAMPDFDTLLAENTSHWRAFWQTCDVQIEGDPENQQGVRYCLFQLHSTYRGLNPHDNIGAKGLTGEGYNGHAFWDTETYCLPFFLFTDPQAARSLLMYRYHTLAQARERASALDLKGACYPVATLDGTEACTLWQHSSLQMQPSTSVAYAIRIYVETTEDQAFLRHEGAEMLVEIARYVLSRGGWNTEGFGFYGVMGPDEFHMMVNNDFYTNFLGMKALRYAADTLAKLTAEELALITQKTALAAHEPAAWRNAAEHMIVPRRENDVFEQHDGYFRLPHIDAQAIPREEFPLYDHWSYDRIYRTDMLKQPDVLMAMMLYPDDFTTAEKAANYAYYAPRCIHESSLSPSVHSILAAELNKPEEALSFFGFATRLDLDNYNRNTSEGLHLSSVAAAWMTIVEGFGGVRFGEGMLSLAPWLPVGWKRLRFTLCVRETLLHVTVDAQATSLRCEGAPLTVKAYGREITIGAEECRIARQEA